MHSLEWVWTVWGSSNYTKCSFYKSAKALKKVIGLTLWFFPVLNHDSKSEKAFISLTVTKLKIFLFLTGLVEWWKDSLFLLSQKIGWYKEREMLAQALRYNRHILGDSYLKSI